MRRPKAWYRTSKSAWYVQHNGQQVRLGEHPEGAAPPKKTESGWNAPPAILDAFYKLMASDPSSVPDAEELVTAQVCDLFLDHSERHNERATRRPVRGSVGRGSRTAAPVVLILGGSV